MHGGLRIAEDGCEFVDWRNDKGKAVSEREVDGLKEVD